MREDDLATLEAAPPAILAQWWCDLNRWRWPSDLADEEPKEHIPGGRRTQIMNWINEKIGMKECLRYWNRETMPGAEFDRWYDNGMRHVPNA